VTVLSFFCLAQKKETKKNAPPDAASAANRPAVLKEMKLAFIAAQQSSNTISSFRTAVRFASRFTASMRHFPVILSGCLFRYPQVISSHFSATSSFQPAPG
jgi:hypothetical protein